MIMSMTRIEIIQQHKLVKSSLERIFKSHKECKIHPQYLPNVLALTSEGFCHVEWREGVTWAVRK